MSRLLAASLLASAALAYAQYAPPYAPAPYTGPQYNAPQFNPQRVSGLIDRVHGDLSRAYEVYRFSGGDRRRLDHAEHELRDFSNKWYRGRFDKGELDEAIGAIQHVVDNNRMPPRERSALQDDANQLRGLREAYDRGRLGYR